MKDVNFSECKFSADIVPYMYGELPAAESSVFESHLVDCCECTDEFAVISNARYEVYEWKKLEFDPLSTPRFVIPYAANEEAAATWTERLRAAFSKSWAVPSLAFAMLAVVSMVTAVFLYSDDGVNEVAGNSNRESLSVTPEVTDAPKSPDTFAARNEVEVEDRRVEPDARPVAAASRTRTESKRPIRNTRLAQRRQVEVKSTSAQNQKAPRLNDFEEDEDTSVRLAQLVEDIVRSG